MNQIFLLSIPFFAVSAFHLASTFFKNQRIADFTKITLMPLLALVPLTTTNFTEIQFHELTMLTIAILAGCFGDFFMIKPQVKKNYLLGILFFAIGHAFYITLTILRQPPFFSVVPFIILVVIYAVFITPMYFMLKKPKGLVGFATVAYACLLMVVNYFCLSPIVEALCLKQAVSALDKTVFLRLAGNLVFLLSDSVLSMTIFTKDFKFSRFVIMITYLSAQ
ncbi:MAG: lysoplasmalogenase, partial [Treponemataceae bacterium]|nr:lysoplasmalogenase [Treponemataceae bacterium]